MTACIKYGNDLNCVSETIGVKGGDGALQELRAQGLVLEAYLKQMLRRIASGASLRILRGTGERVAIVNSHVLSVWCNSRLYANHCPYLPRASSETYWLLLLMSTSLSRTTNALLVGLWFAAPILQVRPLPRTAP